MTSKPKKAIAITLPYGMSARNVLRSNLLNDLLNEAEVLVFTSLYNDPDFLAEFSRPGVHFFDLIPCHSWERHWAVLLSCMETSTWYRQVEHPTFDIIARTIRAGAADDILKQYRYYFAWWVRLVANIPGATKTLRRMLLRHWQRCQYYHEIFNRFSPQLILFTNPFAPQERILTGFVTNKPIRKLAMIHSWDNPTTKCKKPFCYDSLIVWNQILKDQLMRLYDYSDDQIFIAGGLQFDSYQRRDHLEPRQPFLQSLGIPTKRRIVTVACGNPTFVPRQDLVIDTILAATETHQFPDPIHILIRTHPGTPMKELDRFRQHPDITFDEPTIAYTSLPYNSGWQRHAGGTSRFVNVMEHSDVVINFFSTTTIDAAIFDRPIINIAYDPQPTAHPLASCVKHYSLEHYRPIVASGGVRLVHNPEELVDAIGDYLLNPKLDATGRLRIVREQCTFTDAGTAGRVASFMLTQYPKPKLDDNAQHVRLSAYYESGITE